MRVRLATFNAENLFARFRFAARVDPRRAEEEGFTVNDLGLGIFDAGQKHLTAGVIDALAADVVGLQEVESLDALKRFRDRYLGGTARYPYAMASCPITSVQSSRRPGSRYSATSCSRTRRCLGPEAVGPSVTPTADEPVGAGPMDQGPTVDSPTAVVSPGGRP